MRKKWKQSVGSPIKKPKQHPTRKLKIRKAANEDLRFNGWAGAPRSLQRMTAVLCDLLRAKNVSVKMFLALAKAMNPESKATAQTLYQYRARYRDQIDKFGNMKYLKGDKEFILQFIKAYDRFMVARKPVRIHPKPKQLIGKIVLKKRVDKSK